MSEEWGPWIAHNGGGCPVPIGTIVHAVFHCPGWDLRKVPDADDPSIIEIGCDWVIKPVLVGNGATWDRWIVRYRIRKPKGLTILQRIAEQPQDERVDA